MAEGSHKKAEETLHQKSGLVFVEYLNLKGVWQGIKYPLFALEEKTTTKIQDSLDKRFDNSPRTLVNHNCTFNELVGLLEDILVDEDLPAFLWLEGLEKKRRELLQKTVRELYLKAAAGSGTSLDIEQDCVEKIFRNFANQTG